MKDEERTQLERAASLGDKDATRKLNVDDARRGHGLVGFLQTLVGLRIWIEGVRINYRGILEELLFNVDGSVAGLLVRNLERISYFDRVGVPNPNTTTKHSKLRLVPWECVHDIGEEGFLET